jgi:hypothetical protein
MSSGIDAAAATKAAAITMALHVGRTEIELDYGVDGDAGR